MPENKNVNDPSIHRLKALLQDVEGRDVCNTLSDFVPGIVYVYDTGNKKLRYVNKKITEILGYTYDDIDTWEDDWQQLIFNDDRELVTTEIQKFFDLQDHQSHSFNTRLNHKQGNWRYFRTQGTVLRRNEDGRAASVLFIAQDITEHQTTLEENKKLTEIIEETQLMLDFGLWTLDLTTNIAQCSVGYYRLFDYPENQKPEITFESYLEQIPEPYKGRVKAVIEQAQKDAKEYEIEHTIITQKQEKKFVISKGKFVLDDKGKTIKMVGSAMNITKVRKTEEDIDSKIENLNRSNRDLEEFAYIASHDMQEPLRKISTFSERLSLKFKEVLNEEGRAYLNRMSAATETMRQLIDNLLEYSRVTRNLQALEETDLNKILQSVVTELDMIIEETRTTINAGPLPTLNVMPLQIRQLFQNLISNAIKFRKKEEPLVITISSTPLSAAEYAENELPISSNYFKIQVKDNGIGFEKEYAQKIFLIFQRLHGKASYPGSGIGLSICKKIMDNHHGIIYGDSELNVGSTFTVILPR